MEHGKTTTIKLILGLQGITSGKVTINGFDIEKQFTKAISKVGAIIENPDLYMYLTGYDNLKLVANMYPKVSKYSLGMRQRLGVAQAIFHKPNLLILDEPTNGLDPEGIKEMRDLLKELAQKENMAIFISSHNLAELETLCNKVCIIQNGKVIENSSIDQMKKASQSHYKIVVDHTDKLKDYLAYPMEIKNSQEIEVDVTREQVPEVVKVLVKQNVKVYEVQEVQMSLEDAFLKRTGGNKID